MAQGKLELKGRIKTVGSIQKITKAMKLVASAKLVKQRTKMEETKVYTQYLKEMLESIVADLNTNDHVFLKPREGKALYIMITSDMGLCGAYNGNVFRSAKQIPSDSDIIMIGQRGAGWARNSQFHVLNTYSNLPDDAYDELALIMKEAVASYLNNEYGSIHVIYTKFINSVTFETSDVQILPIQKLEKVHSSKKEIIFEPGQGEILNYLVPMYLNGSIFSYYLESKTSEQASRRTAMESATDNAQELQEQLELQYNQARQAAITQEISEIVAGADAL